MTAPTVPAGVATPGPGPLPPGATGTLSDVSSLVNNRVIDTPNPDTDPTTKLCGTVRAGKTTYTYELDGNLDTDIGTDAGLFARTQSAPGSEQPFTFTPSTEAGTSAAGTVVIDPMDFGTTDDYGSNLTSDIAWSLVGVPVYTYGTTTAP